MSPSPLLTSPALLGPAIYLQAVRAGFPSPADDYLDAPIDMSRTLIQNAPATFIMTVAGNPLAWAGNRNPSQNQTLTPERKADAYMQRRGSLVMGFTPGL